MVGGLNSGLNFHLISFEPHPLGKVYNPGWRILTEDYIPMHERPGSRARMLKVVCKSAESLGSSPPPLPAFYIRLSFIFADFGFEPPYLP